MIREVVEVIERKLAGMGFAYIDVDRGQADSEQPSVKYPAALVEITGVGKMLGYVGNSLKLEMGVRVRVLQMVLGNSSTRAPQEQREAWFGFAQMLENVWKELHYNTPELPISYKGITIVKRDDGLSEGDVEFTVSVSEMDNRKAERQIQIEIVKDDEKDKE